MRRAESLQAVSGYFDHPDGSVRREAITVVRQFARPSHRMESDHMQSPIKTCMNFVRANFCVLVRPEAR